MRQYQNILGREKKMTRVELDFQPAAFQSKSIHQTPEHISGLGVPGVCSLQFKQQINVT